MQNLSAVLYLISAVLFILSLKGLSSPATSRKGNTYGMVGMLIAVATTFMVLDKPVLLLIVGAIAAGAAIGAFKAKTVEMTHMPELVAAMHSLVGLSAVLIAVAAIFHSTHTRVEKVELFIGAFIGALQLVDRLSKPSNASAAQTINSALSGGVLSGVATIVSSVVDGFCLFFLFLGIGVSRSHFGQGEDCSQCQ